MANLTVLDIARMNASDGVVGLIEETIQASPEVMGGTARTIRGFGYDTLHRTNVPLVGFRAVNGGTEKCKSDYELKRTETYIMDCASEIDVALAKRHEDGEAAAIALESEGILEGSFRSLSSQFYYGRGSNASSNSIAPDAGLGFPGLAEVVNSSLVVDATGTTSGSATSAYAVKWGTKFVNWVIGDDGAFDTDDPRIVRVVTDAGPPEKCADHWRTPLLFNIGLQLVNPNSIGVIKNLTTESGKGLTDDLIASLLALFPSGMVPDAIYVTRRSKEQIRTSRTTFSPTGQPAPMIENSFGIPIIDSDGIVNTEAVY